MICFHRTSAVQMTGCPVFLLQASKNHNAKHTQNIKRNVKMPKYIERNQQKAISFYISSFFLF